MAPQMLGARLSPLLTFVWAFASCEREENTVCEESSRAPGRFASDDVLLQQGTLLSTRGISGDHVVSPRSQSANQDGRNLSLVNFACGEVEEGVDYMGGDLRMVSGVESALRCSEICKVDARCKSYTFAKDWSGCYLKNELRPGWSQNSCCTSGTPACHVSSSPTPSQSFCSWATPTAADDQLECLDGTLCYGWTCCALHGGRAKCPPNKPNMCNVQTCGDGDYCCKISCDELGGNRPCLNQNPIDASTTSSPSSRECAWKSPTSVDGQLECLDGTLCSGWTCCTSHGGRSKCPPNLPVMCNAKTCGDGDYCCKTSCEDFGGDRQCGVQVPTVTTTPLTNPCPWATATSVDNQLECTDGTLCFGWSCCTGHGGRMKCPPNKPLMCNSKTCGDGEHCCKNSCDAYGGIRPCPGTPFLGILMLGNSYTFYNGGVDGVLRIFLEASGTAHNVRALTLGGSNLPYHLAQASASGTPHHAALASTGSWDFVVFQDQSHVPALCCYTSPRYSDSDFVASAKALVELDKKAEARGAVTVLYQTWGRRDGHKSRSYLSTFLSMSDAVVQGYEHYASLITRSDRKPIIAPVGRAFRLIYEDIQQAGENPYDTSSLFYRLYDPDATHPSAVGTYLAACVVFTSITGHTPIGLPSSLGIQAADAAKLQAKALQAISDFGR